MRTISGQHAALYVVAAASCLALGYVLVQPLLEAKPRAAGKSRHAIEDIPFDGAQAFEFLEQLCDLGPRRSGSEAMARQQTLLTEHFEKLGATVERQEFTARDPETGEQVDLANLVIHWHPQTTDRVLLCTHYDTRPYPDQDPDRPQGRFVGANDGASGTALLMELGRHIPALAGDCGVDFVIFDGEELVFRKDDEYFLGSKYFARQYRANASRRHAYRWGVLLDMVGDRDLELFFERNSFDWPETRPLVEAIWKVARRCKLPEFVPMPRHEVNDDHLALYEIAGIPACDIIDFDYPYWHREGDTPDKCSALSLAKVGWVLHEWLQDEVSRPAPKRRRSAKK